MTIQEFINRERIYMTAEWVDENPNMSDMPAGSSHWKCTFTRRTRQNQHAVPVHKQLTVYFSQGPAHSGEPRIEDVLDCLASDASGFVNDFENWAREYGYETDSRRAERTFNAVKRQSEKLERFLNGSYQELLKSQGELR